MGGHRRGITSWMGVHRGGRLRMGCAGCKVRQVDAAVKEPLPASLAKAPRGRHSKASAKQAQGKPHTVIVIVINGIYNDIYNIMI